MSEQLSKDEVDALLQGVQDGEVPVEADRPPRGTVQGYDLLADDRLSGRRFPALDLVHERFVRRLRLSLASLVGVTPTITVATPETLRFTTFRNRLPPGACLQLFTMAPLRGQALLAISAPLAFGLVDRTFGGPGVVPESLETREYSALALQTLQRLGTAVLHDLAEAWTPVQRVECAFVRIEPNPAYLTIAAAADAVVAVEFGCDLGSGTASFVVAMPYAMLEPIRDRLGAPQVTPTTGTDREWLARITTAVRHAEVSVSAELGSREISARELLRLRVGDVLPLGARGDDPVVLRVDHVRLMTGLAGVSRGQNAVRILARDRGE